MENQNNNLVSNTATTPRKRKKKTVTDIELQIKELQKKKEEMILKSKADIGDFVLTTLAKEDITIEDIEDNKELFLEELGELLKTNSKNFFDLMK